MSSAVTPVNILACGVLSPAGQGPDALAEALRAGIEGHDDASDFLADPLPAGRPVRAVPGFDARDHLGRKGLRALSRVSLLGMSCAELALRSWGTEPDPAERADTGVVFGTCAGSVRATTEFTRETLELERPYLVSPSMFPGTIYNATASQIAMRHGLTGANATLSEGSSSALAALRYGRGLLIRGRARRLLAGAADELSAQVVWGLERSGLLSPGTPVGEGGAMFLLERDSGHGPRPEAQLLATVLGYTPPGTGALARGAALSDTVAQALAESGVGADQVSLVVPGSSGRGWAAVERRALNAVLAGRPVEWLTASAVTGVTFGAGGALALAALLGTWRKTPPPADRPIALVTSVGADGTIGCAVVRHAG
ncbi:beta-ketoacyl synthase N-terminal-like domain-containing protein [Streptomyces xanthochromogenes]|uniref:beta-ketoacyl synthase N-terminal-like domain-containing protein n=1 Tax=Streptomyces xanthochromogenes TaxID=67384 RepID=UPI00344398B5